MGSQNDSQVAANLKTWCSEVNLDPNYAFVLCDDTADIYETAQTVKAQTVDQILKEEGHSQYSSKIIHCDRLEKLFLLQVRRKWSSCHLLHSP